VVFLVDDDEAVRDAVATALRGAGFAVASFGSARQFLDTYAPGQRGCLIVDLDLPGVEPELQGMLVSSEVALPVIVTTRRLRRRILAPALSAFAAVLLEKPFGVDELVPLVEAAIASGGDRG
jgi:FixJ family two-component response regulator